MSDSLSLNLFGYKTTNILCRPFSPCHKKHSLPYPSLQQQYKISLFIQPPLSEFLENQLKMDDIGSKKLWKQNSHSLWVKHLCLTPKFHLSYKIILITDPVSTSRWKALCQKFSSLALTVWELWCFEDWEEKEDWINELINELVTGCL